jgi:two-component system KDP operon response regulator KdpE
MGIAVNRMDVLLITRAEGPLRLEVDGSLEKEGYAVVCFDEPVSLLAHLRGGAGDAVLIDAAHVEEAARLVSEIAGLTGKPILVIHHPDDSAQALDLILCGAHDFVCRDPQREQPMHPRELRTRLSTAIHFAARRDRPQREWLSLGDLIIDMVDHAVWKGDQLVDLSRTEYQLLLQLVANPQALLTHDDLLRNVWSEDQCGRVHYLRTYVSRLRKKLGWNPDTATPQIQSVRGEGYRLMLNRSVGSQPAC